jgi:hypothetical protein
LTRLVKLKKSSARRKKPRCVRFDHVSFSCAASARAWPSVLSARTSSPPTTTEPTAAARASSTVDFPDPFSPTRNVTALRNFISLNFLTTGSANGKPSSSLAAGLMSMERR